MKKLLIASLFTAMLALFAVSLNAAEGKRITVLTDGAESTQLITNAVPEAIAARASLTRQAIGLTNLANIGIQTGTITAAADGSKTNTFTTAFSAAPNVIVVCTGEDNSVTNSVSITSSNFVWTSGKGAQTGAWIAIGAP